jgi:hypothetical protein
LTTKQESKSGFVFREKRCFRIGNNFIFFVLQKHHPHLHDQLLKGADSTLSALPPNAPNAAHWTSRFFHAEEVEGEEGGEEKLSCILCQQLVIAAG